MKKFTLTLALVSVFFSLFSFSQITSQSDFSQPPIATKKHHELIEFDKTRSDDYFWLKERSNPMTLQYLEAENNYSEMVMKSTEGMREKLFNEMKSRITEQDTTAPEYYNGYYYYSRTESGKQYKIFCRKKGSLDAPEEIMFDVNRMALGKLAFILANFDISTNNRYAAYTSNETGSYAEFTLKVRDLESGIDIEGFEINNVQSFVWANDNRTLFYTVNNEALRPFRVYRHDIFSTEEKAVVFEEKDDLFVVNLQKAKTNDYIFINSSSFNTSESFLLDSNNPKGQFVSFMPREKDVIYRVYHHKNNFYIQYKDKQNINGKIFLAPLNEFNDKNKWKEIWAHDENIMIDYLEVYEDFYAVQIRQEGLKKIATKSIGTSHESEIVFPEPVYSVDLVSLPDYYSEKLRYGYTSLNRPLTTYDYFPETGKTTVVKTTVIPGGFDPKNYIVERIYATSHDSIRVPIALLYKKGLVKDGNNPALIYAYGSYGYSTDARFMSNFYSLVDRGYVFALAHVRGGSEMGKQWYEGGKLLNKKNTFIDFIACSEELIKQKYTNSSLLSIMGGSAGGLLVTAVTNMRPDLFNTVVASVPFVDVMSTMLDPSLPLTTQEYEEWGNPNIKEYYDYMLSYSPYDNIKRDAYPNILVTAGLNDSQVSYHEPAKYVAKLREYKTDNNLLLLKTNMQSGHGGATGRFDQLKEVAFRLAFILDRDGIKE